MRPEDLIETIRGQPDTKQYFRLGAIPGDYVSGRPSVQFDGESSASTKTYPYLSSYTPAANDRVLLSRVGNGWVVLGMIV